MAPRQRGFTLIELLVVISVVGVLLALLLPAVQAARESARRARCAGHLKQIALAMLNYENSTGVLPPAKKGCCWGTWLVYTLPYLEQIPLYNSWNVLGNNTPGWPIGLDTALRYFGPANVTTTSTRLDLYLCPSDLTNAPISSTVGASTYSCTSQNYAVNFGNTIAAQTAFQGMPFLGAPFGDIGSPLADHNQPAHSCVPLSAISDGLAATLMASEVVVGQGRDLRGFSWWGDAAAFEALHSPNTTFPDVLFSAYYCQNQPPNPPCMGATTAIPDCYAARSRHPGGVNAVFCDGSVHFIKNSIAIDDWRALSTAHGNEIGSGEPY
jgi:prepilin-type N-terminal cleavage/methylation domain-containing protein/prepilin-type processing-associated H-X9-DG protein